MTELASARSPVPVPGGRYRYRVLAVGTLAQAAYFAFLIGFAALAPDLQDRFRLGLSAVAVVFTAAGAGQTLTLLAWGMASDRVGERAVATIGLGGAAAALAAAAWTSSFALFCVLAAAAGASGAGVGAATGRAVMAWFTRRERGLALSVRQTAIPVGGAVAALVLPPLAGSGGLRAALLALAAGCAVAAVFAFVVLRDPPHPESDGPALVARPLRDRAIWRLAVAGGLLIASQVLAVNFCVLFLHGSRGYSTAAAGAVLAGVQGVGIVMRLAAGHWSDRRGTRVQVLRRLAVALALLLAVEAAVVDAPAWALVPVLLVAGGMTFSWNGVAFAATVELVGRRRAGTALGVQQSAVAIGGTVVPVLFAPLVAATSWRLGIALMACTPLLAVYALRLVPEQASG